MAVVRDVLHIEGRGTVASLCSNDIKGTVTIGDVMLWNGRKMAVVTGIEMIRPVKGFDWDNPPLGLLFEENIQLGDTLEIIDPQPVDR